MPLKQLARRIVPDAAWDALGRLHCRCTTWPRLSSAAGGVYAIAGQSNAAGTGTRKQSWQHPTLRPAMLNRCDVWTTLADTRDGEGTAWPAMATVYMAKRKAEPGFVPCAVGGIWLAEYLPGTDNFSRLVARCRQAARFGNLRAVLWWQGENEVWGGWPHKRYAADLCFLASAVRQTLGVPLMPCKIQTCKGLPPSNHPPIWDAVEAVWHAGPHVAVGPDLSGIISDDDYHITTDEKLTAAGQLWFDAIDAAGL